MKKYEVRDISLVFQEAGIVGWRPHASSERIAGAV